MNEPILLICTDKLTTSNNFLSLCGSRLFNYVHVITHYGLNKVNGCFTSISIPTNLWMLLYPGLHRAALA